MATPIDQVPFNELAPTLKALAKAGATTEHMDWIRSRGNAKRLVQMIDEVRGIMKLVAHPKSAPARFTSPEDQLKRLRELNSERGWGFSDVAFLAVEQSIPSQPKGGLVAIVLVPYLDEKKNKKGEVVMSGVEHTFQELWIVAAAVQRANWRWDGYDKAGPDRLRLLKGIEHASGLRWEVIDLGCQRNCKPVDVRQSEKSPHAGILAAAVLHPEWIKAMDGDIVPFVFIPGYEVNVPERGEWRDVPRVYFDRGHRQVELNVGWNDSHTPYWAVPSFLRE